MSAMKKSYQVNWLKKGQHSAPSESDVCEIVSSDFKYRLIYPTKEEKILENLLGLLVQTYYDGRQSIISELKGTLQITDDR